MNIEKICRTCLTLNGPLLSIYDDSNNESCCLADMLSELIISKPHLCDNMPQQVCLTCISEINRCYAFRNKCISSDRTLRQLLPNTLNPSPLSLTSLVTSAVNDNIQSVEVGVQTEFGLYTTHSVDGLITQDTDDTNEFYLNDCGTQTEVEYLLVKQETSSDKLSLKVKQQQSQNTKKDVSFSNCSTKLLPSPNTTQLICFEGNNCKFNVDKNTQIDKQEETYVLMEEGMQTVSNLNDTIELVEYLAEDEQGEIDDNDVATTSSHFEYYDDGNVDAQTNTNTSHYERVSTHSSSATDEIAIATAAANAKSNPTISEINNGEYETVKARLCTNYENDNDDCDTKAMNAKSKTSSNTSIYRLCSRKQEYKCPHCIMTFVSLKTLRRHLLKRHNIDSAPADITLKKQILEKPLIVVDFNDVNKNNIRTQIVANNLNEVNIPSVGLKNVVKPQLVSRERVASPANVSAILTKFKYFCELCNAGFAQRKTLLFHKKQNICTSNNFKCWMCDRIFITQDNLDAHITTHANQHTCVECEQLFENVEDLSQHMIDQHKRSARNQCCVCKKVFTMKTSLIDHMRIHSGEKPFPCTVCGKSFRQNSNLRQHLMRHTNEKNFICDICSTAFVTKAELFSHKRTHTGDHPFKCNICETRFTSSSSLQKHCRKHTGERPYACEFCPMRFTALNVLKNHRRTHTGEKPFKCNYCGKSFTQKGDCQMHQRAHTEKNLRCFCGARFNKYSNLRHHKRKQHKSNDGNDQDTINRVQFTFTKNEDNMEESEELLIIHDGNDNDSAGDNARNMLISEQHAEEDNLVEIALQDMC